MKFIIVLLFAVEIACGQSNSVGPKVESSSAFIKAQAAVINKHAKVLMDEGRMPRDFASAFTVLGQYGWHGNSRSGKGLSSVGTRPEMRVLQNSVGGSFGAYSFYQPAFEQAKRSWWIHGIMRAGSDLLVAVNRNAAFTAESRCSYTWSSGGPPEGTKNCPPEMNSPVGFKVGFMYKGPEGATVLEVINGSTLRLDKKSPGDVLSYDIGILPPDYVDMCACTSP